MDSSVEIDPRFAVASYVEWDHPQGWGMFTGVVVAELPFSDGVPVYGVLVLDGPGSLDSRNLEMTESELRPRGARYAYVRVVNNLLAARALAAAEAVWSIVDHIDALIADIVPKDGQHVDTSLASEVVQELVLALGSPG